MGHISKQEKKVGKEYQIVRRPTPYWGGHQKIRLIWWKKELIVNLRILPEKEEISSARNKFKGQQAQNQKKRRVPSFYWGSPVTAHNLNQRVKAYQTIGEKKSLGPDVKVVKGEH